MSKKKAEYKNAFSLIEVIVALAITAILATSIFFLFTQSTITNTETKNKQTASRIAQNRIEELRNMPFTEMANEAEDVTVSDLSNGHRITRINNSYGNDIKEVEVEVTWTDRTSIKNVKIDTLIYNKGS